MSFSSRKNKRISSFQIATVIAIVFCATLAIFSFNKKESDKKSEKTETAKNEDNKNSEVYVSGIDQSQKIKTVKDVEEVISKWIENNPQAVIRAVENMQFKAMNEKLKNAQKNIANKKDQIFNDKNSPSHSPSDYDIEIVEFYDYNCGYCKKAQSTVEQIIKSDSKVKIIYKEFPVLGEQSHEMARVSIAVNMVNPGSFKKFHDNLMKSSERGKSAAIKIAKSSGIDTKKIEAILSKEKDKIDQILQSNIVLGSEIGINGTPAFIIGEELIPGAIELSSFKEKIKNLRERK